MIGLGLGINKASNMNKLLVPSSLKPNLIGAWSGRYQNDYGVDVRPILPIEAIALQWLSYAGVRVVPDDAEAFDAWVRITVNGQALQSDYQDGKTRYTGARLTGEILFAKGDGSRYAEEFTGEEETAFIPE